MYHKINIQGESPQINALKKFLSLEIVKNTCVERVYFSAK